MGKYKNDKSHYVVRIAVFLFFLCLGLVFLTRGFKENTYYNQNREEVVKLTATVSSVERYYDSNGDVFSSAFIEALMKMMFGYFRLKKC